MLIWAALRAHAHWKFIGWGLGTATGFLVGGQALAVVTGLASGATEPGGWQWALVLGSLALYRLAIISVGGIMLLRNLFKPQQLSMKKA